MLTFGEITTQDDDQIALLLSNVPDGVSIIFRIDCQDS